jgi:hypothetical protein
LSRKSQILKVVRGVTAADTYTNTSQRTVKIEKLSSLIVEKNIKKQRTLQNFRMIQKACQQKHYCVKLHEPLSSFMMSEMVITFISLIYEDHIMALIPVVTRSEAHRVSAGSNTVNATPNPVTHSLCTHCIAGLATM